MDSEPSVTNSKTTMEAVTDSEAPQSDRVTNPAFERGGLWMSSFHGDRYTQEDIYKVADHVKVRHLLMQMNFIENVNMVKRAF